MATSNQSVCKTKGGQEHPVAFATALRGAELKHATTVGDALHWCTLWNTSNPTCMECFAVQMDHAALYWLMPAPGRMAGVPAASVPSERNCHSSGGPHQPTECCMVRVRCQQHAIQVGSEVFHKVHQCKPDLCSAHTHKLHTADHKGTAAKAILSLALFELLHILLVQSDS